MFVYRCSDTYESIFSAIYQVYEEHRQQEEVYLALNDELFLFAEDVEVIVLPERSEKVANTILKQFGRENFEWICYALATSEADKAQAVYRTIRQGLNRCGQGHLFDNLADKGVLRAFELARAASREVAHLRGFLRFEELKNTILYARIAPKNDVVSFLMPHFADRFPCENFIIHDEKREIFGVHPACKNRKEYRNCKEQEAENDFFFVSGRELPEEFLETAEAELKYQMLFKNFCTHISIKERRNTELQRNMLPLYFREYMAEFR